MAKTRPGTVHPKRRYFDEYCRERDSSKLIALVDIDNQMSLSSRQALGSYDLGQVRGADNVPDRTQRGKLQRHR